MIMIFTRIIRCITKTSEAELIIKIHELDKWLDGNSYLATDIPDGKKYPPKKYTTKVLQREMLRRKLQRLQAGNEFE